MLKKVTLLLPLTFNDGSTIPLSVRQTIKSELYFAYGGWTDAGEVTGAYHMKEGNEEKVERLQQLWIVLPEEELNNLRAMVAPFAAILRQEVIYFEMSGAAVEMIRPTPIVEDEHD